MSRGRGRRVESRSLLVPVLFILGVIVIPMFIVPLVTNPSNNIPSLLEFLGTGWDGFLAIGKSFLDAF